MDPIIKCEVYRELRAAGLGHDLQADAEGSGRDVEKVFASGKRNPNPVKSTQESLSCERELSC